MRYRRATLDEIRAAATSGVNGDAPVSLGSWYQSQRTYLQPYRDAVRGGSSTLKFLIPKPDEDPILWKMRVESFQNINVCEIVVDEQSHFAYGIPPERKVAMIGTSPEDTSNGEISTALKEIYEENQDYTFFRQRLVPSSISDQWSWQKIWYDEEKSVRFSRLKRECVYPVRDPLDPDDTLLGAVQIYEVGPAKYDFRLWTMDDVYALDGEWNPTAREPNPFARYGVIPFIPYGDLATDGKHQLSDAFMDQVVLINMRSWELAGWRAQAFAIFVAAGQMVDEETVSDYDGRKRTRVGMESFLQFEKDGKFYAVNPNFPIEQVRKAQSDILREALERAKVSSTAIDPSGTPEQPWSLIIKHLRPLQDRQLNIASFGASEKQALYATAAAAHMLGQISVDPRALDFDVVYPQHVLPINEVDERKADLGDVESNLRLAEDYVTRWVKAGASKEEIDSYMRLLDQQRGARSQGVLELLGSPRGRGSLTQEIYPNAQDTSGEPSGVTYGDRESGGGSAAGVAPGTGYVGGGGVPGFGGPPGKRRNAEAG